MNFDEIPENKLEQYPCDCGGNIELTDEGDFWECDSCNFRKEIIVEISND